MIFFYRSECNDWAKEEWDIAQQNNLIIAAKEIQALYELLKAKSIFLIIKKEIY